MSKKINKKNAMIMVGISDAISIFIGIVPSPSA